MINHGLSTGALFLLIGMVYERYHTRSMKELGGLAAVDGVAEKAVASVDFGTQGVKRLLLRYAPVEKL